MKILYKAVAAILALAVIPVILFVPMYSYAASSWALELISDTKYVADTSSLYEIASTVTELMGDDTSDKEMSADSTWLIKRVAALGGLLALICVAAIVAAVLAIVRKKGFGACCASVFGIALSVLFVQFFNSTVEPFIEGSKTIGSLINLWIADLVADVEYVYLAGGMYYVFGLFAAVILWTVMYTLTEDKKQPASAKA